jgi:hypothetical protein
MIRQKEGWISGDTVLHDEVRQVADRFQVGVALLHLGEARFPVTGPVRSPSPPTTPSTSASSSVPRTAIPVHYEGWSHLRQGRQAIEQEFANAPADIRRCLQLLPIGAGTDIAT